MKTVVSFHLPFNLLCRFITFLRLKEMINHGKHLTQVLSVIIECVPETTSTTYDSNQTFEKRNI